MLITASVFTMTAGFGLCFTRLSQVNDSLISSTMALHKDLWAKRGRRGDGLGGVIGRRGVRCGEVGEGGGQGVNALVFKWF